MGLINNFFKAREEPLEETVSKFGLDLFHAFKLKAPPTWSLVNALNKKWWVETMSSINILYVDDATYDMLVRVYLSGSKYVLYEVQDSTPSFVLLHVDNKVDQ